MIYVILAIIILFVSFFVALTSLLKEQKKLQDTESKNRYPETLKVKDQDGTVNVEAAPPSALVEPTKDNASLAANDVGESQNRPPFPWENEFASDSTKQMSEEDREIAKITKELQSVKAESKQDTTELPINHEPNEEHDSGPQLAGEISMKDIVRKSK